VALWSCSVNLSGGWEPPSVFREERQKPSEARLLRVSLGEEVPGASMSCPAKGKLNTAATSTSGISVSKVIGATHGASALHVTFREGLHK